MTRITARGKRWGHTVNIEVRQDNSGKIEVQIDGKASDYNKQLLDGEALAAPPMANGYWPERGTMLAYYNTLFRGFFDKLEKLDVVEGTLEEIPYEPGTIY